MQIFYYWPIFESVSFFIPQTLFNFMKHIVSVVLPVKKHPKRFAMPMDFKTSPQMYQISKKKYCRPKECKAPMDKCLGLGQVLSYKALVGEALRNALDFNGTLAFQGIQILFSTCRILLSIAHQYFKC